MTLEEFRLRFINLKKSGFIPSLRKGPTGIGYTFETMLELDENNLKLPDIGDYELKAHRSRSNSMITLFTADRKAWKMNPFEAVLKYGTPDPYKPRLNLYFTLSQTPSQHGLYYQVFKDGVGFMHISDGLIAFWEKDILIKAFKKKFPALILVTADSIIKNEHEYFHYNKADLYWDPSPDLLISNFDNGNLLLDIRIHQKPTSARNHGTGFRTYERNLGNFFNSHKEII